MDFQTCLLGFSQSLLEDQMNLLFDLKMQIKLNLIRFDMYLEKCPWTSPLKEYAVLCRTRVSVQTAHVAEPCSIKASPDLPFHILCEMEHAKLQSFECVSEKLGNVRVLPLTSSRSYRPSYDYYLVRRLYHEAMAISLAILSSFLGKVSIDQTWRLRY